MKLNRGFLHLHFKKVAGIFPFLLLKVGVTWRAAVRIGGFFPCYLCCGCLFFLY